MHIHWLGAGLSSVAGLKELLQKNIPLTIWNRRPKEGLPTQTLDWDALVKNLHANDVIVSMLPTTMHTKVLELCQKHRCHFLCASYLTTEMRSFQADDLSFVAEFGLDPGLDHLLAHQLVDTYQREVADWQSKPVSLYSYCGGFPEQQNEIHYKFSWCPLGVIKALQREAIFRRQGQSIQHKHAVQEIWFEEIMGEKLEAYANGNSLSYINEYFPKEMQVDSCIRGTLRPQGWWKAWEKIYQQSLEYKTDQDLLKIARKLWQNYPYEENDFDRVLLSVRLENQAHFQRSIILKLNGNSESSAMSQLVSLPLAFAVEEFLANRMPQNWQTISYLANNSQSFWQYMAAKNIFTLSN